MIGLSQFDAVTFLERFVPDLPSVEKCAVGALEIPDGICAAGAAHLRMVAGDHDFREYDVVVGFSAQPDRIPVKLVSVALLRAMKVHKDDRHWAA